MANEFTGKRVAEATYSFAVDGGATGTIIPATLADFIPSGAIITNCIVNMTTAATSGGSATISITGGGVTIAGAGAYSSSPYSGTSPQVVGRSTGLTTTAPYIPIVATSTAQIAVVIATAALTAGVFTVYVEYYID